MEANWVLSIKRCVFHIYPVIPAAVNALCIINSALEINLENLGNVPKMTRSCRDRIRINTAWES